MKWILLGFMFFLHLSGVGQKPLNLIFKTNSYQQLKKNPTTNFKDSATAYNYLNELQRFALKKGYLLASYDSISPITQNNIHVDFNLGNKFSSANLRMSDKELSYLKKHTALREKIIAQTPLSPNELSRIMNTIQNAYLEDGYPFVSIYLDSFEFTDDQLTAQILVNRGNYYKWEKIHIRGDSSITAKYISNLIGIREGDVYNEKSLATISKRIAQVNFLKEIKSSETLFTPEGAELFLYLNSLPISSINGIVGLQPDPQTQRLSVTGEVTLKLINVLKKGESLNIDWRAIRPQTQSLKSQISIPFLFKTSFGVEGKFNLYKRDSTFLELSSTLGVNYFLKGGNYLKAYYLNNSSSLLSGSNSSAAATSQASVKSNNYGLGIFRRQIDYIPNPSQGFVIYLESSVGSRKSQKTDSSSVIKSTLFRGSIDLEFYVPITKRNVIKLKNWSNFYSAPTVFSNELTRFGGLNNQRGFNEEELFASAQTTFTIEYRFLLDRNSHVFAFYDQTWYENNASTYFNDTPYGFGVGFSFGTNLGIFSLSYALGKQFNNPILLNNGKIHFGYIAYF